MSRRSKGKGDTNTPSVTSPGELPAEVTHGDQLSAIDKARARDGAEVFAMIRRELGNGGFVTLSRSHAGSGQFKPAYVGTMPADDFSIERVTDIYGGGDFIAKGRTAGGTFSEERRFTIDHTIPPKNPKTPQAEKAAPAAPAVDVASVIREVVASTRGETSGLVDLAKSVIAGNGQNNNAPMLEMMKFIFTAQQEQAKTFATLIQKSEERTAAILEKLSSAKGGSDIETELEKFARMAEMMGFTREGGGSDDEKGSWAEKLGKGLGAVAIPMLEKYFTGGAPVGPVPVPMGPGRRVALTAAAQPAAAISVQPIPPAASATNGAAAATTVQPIDPNNENVKAAIERFRVAALAAALKNKDPYDFVENVLVFIPGSFHGVVFETANAPDWFQRIFGADPEATKYLQFVNDMRGCVLLRALVAHAATFKQGQQPADETARKFIGWVNPDFHDALAGVAETDEHWHDLFSDWQAPDPWLDALRAALNAEFEEDDEPAQPAVVVPITAAQSGAAEAAKPVTARAQPTPAKARGKKIS